MLIEVWPIDRPKDYPKNARKWSAKQSRKSLSSIREYGWRQPIVVDARRRDRHRSSSAGGRQSLSV